jgi:inner membrane protein
MMPSAIAHAVVASSVGFAFPRRVLPRKAWLVGCLCAVAPDLDTIAFRFGIPYNHPFGHRGFFHGLAFAALLAVVVSLVVARVFSWRTPRWALAVYLFIATASHGVLDTFTNGGLGIALLSPFSNHRFFAPVRPIAVSPISVRAFFSEWGLRVFLSELLWVGVPCLVMVLAAAWCRRRFVQRHPGGA